MSKKPRTVSQSLLGNNPRQGDAGVPDSPEGVYFTVMTGSLYVIPLIVHLLTKGINNDTKY